MPLDVRHAVQNILSHKYVKQLDIGQIQDLSCKNARQFSAPMHTARKSSRSFLVSAGIGFDAAVCAEALDSPIKRFLNRIHLGKFTYVGIALHQIFSSAPFKAKVVFDGEPPQNVPFFQNALYQRHEPAQRRWRPEADHPWPTAVTVFWMSVSSTGCPRHCCFCCCPPHFSESMYISGVLSPSIAASLCAFTRTGPFRCTPTEKASAHARPSVWLLPEPRSR